MNDDTLTRRDYLAQYGAQLVDQGYSVIPIKPGKKSPGFNEWQKSKSTRDQIRSWLDNGFKQAGIGILTKFTCAIDIDVLDEKCAKHLEAWCLQNIGPAPVRIGRAPKRLLLYRTTEPFHKLNSTVYKDEWGDTQKIEVLGNGEQFVAFHIHPETGKPYLWVDGRSPLNVRATELTELPRNKAEELIKQFESLAKFAEWDIASQGRNLNGKRNGSTHSDDPFVEDTSPINMTFEELRQRVLLIPVDGDYHRWCEVGMALHHQFGGTSSAKLEDFEQNDGYKLWVEWSEASDVFDLHEINEKWPGFCIYGKGRAPTTARYILELAKESVRKTSLELSLKLNDAFQSAKDVNDWNKARDITREADIDRLSRARIASVAKQRLDMLTGAMTPLVDVKKELAYAPKKNERTPTWCDPWVYDVASDKFFSTEAKISATKQGFDAMYGRYALTKNDIVNGRANPSMTASDQALNVWKIRTVDGQRYMPGRDPIFRDPSGLFVNTYPEHEIPEKPEKMLPRDVRNVERVKKHIEHLLADPREQRMLIDWMSWVVQNPGKFARYAVLLQGVEGDGKTFLAEMMCAVMGISNVRVALANTIINSDFTAWAYGQCLCCIEEIRITSGGGHDKWVAINKIKPFITNATIPVHLKGLDEIKVINTTSYMMFSNYQDALPLNDDTRRYLVLFSRWQTRDAIREFKEKHPRYFDLLYATFVESPGALRQWLLNHQQADDFNPMGDAPETAALWKMITKSKPEFILILNELIRENQTLGASKDLIDITELQDVFVSMGVKWPEPKTLSAQLDRDGYREVGKIFLGEAGRHRFYARDTSRFESVDQKRGIIYIEREKVLSYLALRKISLIKFDLDDV